MFCRVFRRFGRVDLFYFVWTDSPSFSNDGSALAVYTNLRLNANHRSLATCGDLDYKRDPSSPEM